MAKTELWMNRAMRRKPGALHRQLGIPISTRIPKTLLATITSADTGEVVMNPTTVGKRRYTVTRLMQKRSTPVLTAHRFHRPKRHRGRLVK